MKKLKNEIIEFIREYVKNSGLSGVVLGMSGGKDSLVTAKLCAEAIGPENVFGIIMPDGKMKDIEIAKRECELLGINYNIIDSEKITTPIKLETSKILQTSNLSDVTTLNIAPRVRMTVLYSVAGTLGCLVANTSNLSEAMIGYTTKWGDNVGDFAPLGNLTKSEVCELGLELGLPKELVMKMPEDGLSSKTDEDKIGFSYTELDEYIRTGKKSKNFNKIMKMHNASAHKRDLPPKFDPEIENHFNNDNGGKVMD